MGAPGVRMFVVSGATPFEPADCPALASDAAGVLRRRAPALVEAFERRRWALPETIDRVYSPRALCALGWRPRHGFAEVLRQLDDASPQVLPEPD